MTTLTHGDPVLLSYVLTVVLVDGPLLVPFVGPHVDII